MKRIIAVVTDNCNFTCKTCLREYERGHDLDPSIFIKILPELKKLKYDHVSITGGEPIFYQYFDEFLKIITTAGLTFNIVSNGYFWKRYVPYVEKYRNYLTHMDFSLDGATAEIHDSIRQKGSYVKVIEAFENFNKLGIRTSAITCLNKINKNEIEKIIDLAEKIKCNVFLFGGVVGTDFNKNIVLNIKERADSLKIINSLRKKVNLRINAGASLILSDAINLCCELDSVSGAAINPQGELIFCCNSIKNGASMGSLKNSTFLELYLKALDLANEIKKVRAEALCSGNTPDEFHGCHYCNKFLSDHSNGFH